MGTGEPSLLSLFRCELTAVNQQFVHILALREQGDQETAARIAEIDDIEFPNTMRIAEHLIARDVPIKISGDDFVTGWDHESILAAERTMEDRMESALSVASRSCRRPSGCRIFPHRRSCGRNRPG